MMRFASAMLLLSYHANQMAAVRADHSRISESRRGNL
jgi:hypothetical protein